jgi:hypothetical protein
MMKRSGKVPLLPDLSEEPDQHTACSLNALTAGKHRDSEARTFLVQSCGRQSRRNGAPWTIAGVYISGFYVTLDG